MKIIKFILVIVTGLVICFLSLGLLVKETKYIIQIQIEKPLNYVFTEFNDVSKFKEWIPEFKSTEIIEEKLGKIGSEYKITVDDNGQDVIMKEKVLAFIPNEKVTLFYNAREGSMLKTNDYVFSFKDSTTTIMHEATCRSESYLMACMVPIFKSKFKKQDQQYLNNFKTLLENE